MNGAGTGRRAPRLLPGAASAPPGLTLAIALLSLLAVGDILAATATIRALGPWSSRLGDAVTIVAAGRRLESADAGAARTVEILQQAPGVTGAWVLEPTTADRLVARILGVADEGPSGGPPRLVAVRSRGTPAPTTARITALLRGQGLNAAADDHGAWSGPVERLAIIGAAGAAAVIAGLVAILAGLVTWGARRAVTRRRDRLTLLVHLGAAEAMLVPPFRMRLVLGAALGALLGTTGAVGVAAWLRTSPQAASGLANWGLPAPLDALTPDVLALDVLTLGAIALWPLIATVIAAWVAQRSAKAALRRLS